jgi:hypothetical protein
MQEKQKVTLYIPPELHRQLKIKAAVEGEPMSALAERALHFYLHHSEVVDQVESYGQTHQVYGCPECNSGLVLRDGELVALTQQGSVLTDDSLSMAQVCGDDYTPHREGEELAVR